MTRLTLYSRPGCHLCDDMKAVVGRVVDALPGGTIALQEIDISTDAVLEQLYGPEIPVLLVDGRKAAKFRLTEEDLRRNLRRVRPG
jgi:hypothetical protein